MLIYLSIENFAIIEFAEIELNPQLTVITGETGAGKSIIIDALEILMGKKTDASIIRAGHDRATLSAIFDIKQLPQAKSWLLSHELIEADDEECTISRIINREGRQRHSINGQPVPQQTCRDLAPLLLNILGQHQAQHLLRQQDCHAWLDCFAGLQKPAATVKQHYQHWADLHAQIETLQKSLSEKNARFDLLQYQVMELNQVELTEKHITQLNETHKRMSQHEKLQLNLGLITDLLGETERYNVLQSFNQIESLLVQCVNCDDKLKPLKETIEQAMIPAQEAYAQARDYLSSLHYDPEQYQAIEDELACIHQLARKYRLSESELPALKARLNAEFSDLDRGDEKLKILTQERDNAAKDYADAANALTQAREKAAQKLSKQVTQHIQQLGMPHAQFKVVCQAREQAIHPHGAEAIRFDIMPNPGQPWQPMSKIASGGELSRIHLAMNVEMKHQDNLPTLICDEIDTGIGGQTSHLIGKLLQTLGQQQQVLTVTHLAPIAALGQQHCHVHKFSKDGQTFTTISTLDENARVNEVARMLGGKDVTQQTRALAKELLETTE